MYHIYCYIPQAHLASVKAAMFKAGAGKIGNYDSCCWQTKGKGQYRPLAGSNPFQGKQDNVEQEEEYKIEMVCEEHHVKKVIEAMKEAHPYEEPAYGFWLMNEY